MNYAPQEITKLDKERFVQAILLVQSLDHLWRQCLVTVPRSAGNEVHQRKGDEAHHQEHYNEPENTADDEFIHFKIRGQGRTETPLTPILA